MLKSDFLAAYEKVAAQYQTDTTTNGVRHYHFNNDLKYRSVTTMLSALSDKAWLNFWYAREGKAKCVAITQESCEFGSQMHSNCEAYLKSEDAPFTDGEGYGLFENIKPLLLPISEVWAQEIVVWSHKHHLAGRLDCLGIYEGLLTMIDFKSARALKTKSDIFNYIMQTTLYCYMLEELFGLQVEQIAILIGQRMDKHGFRPQAQKFVFPANKYKPELEKLLKTYDRVFLTLDHLKMRRSGQS